MSNRVPMESSPNILVGESSSNTKNLVDVNSNTSGSTIADSPHIEIINAALTQDKAEHDTDESDFLEEIEIQFPEYVEELKNEILQKVMARTSVPRTESRDSNKALCRICYDDTDDIHTPPAYLCNCKGTMGVIHVHCMQKWLNEKSTDTCELCHFRFHTRFEPTEPNIGWSMVKFLFLDSRRRGFEAPNSILYFVKCCLITFFLSCFNLFVFSFIESFDSEPAFRDSTARYTSYVCILMIVWATNWMFLSMLTQETATHYWIWYYWWLRTFKVTLLPSTLGDVAVGGSPIAATSSTESTSVHAQ